MSLERRSSQGQKIIKERIDPRAIDALMSTYRDAQVAVLDLVDNAVDNRIEGKPLSVRVRIQKDELSIINQGGYGLDFEGLNNYFVWGHSDKTEGKIGKFGVGGKAAMGFLGRGMEITCSAANSNTEYKVSDTTWETRQGELKQYTPEEKTAFSEDGYFKVRITNLKKDISARALIAKLAETYRPLILSGDIKISVNGIEVEPAEIKYIEEEGISPIGEKLQTRFGDWLVLRAGILAEGQKVKPGIRCYYNGRLIEEEEFFGHRTPAQMSSSSRLFGEADLDFVPVTTNKSDFDKSSVQWEMASRAIHNKLTPIVERLATMRSESTKIERWEQDLAKEAKKILDSVLAETQAIVKPDLRGKGSASGREKPTGEIITDHPKTGKTHKSTEGETAPKLTAEGKTKRWGSADDYEIVSMGVTDKRAEYVEERGKLILKINAEHPLYQTAKKLGDDAIRVYNTETATIYAARKSINEGSVHDYFALVDTLLERCGRILQNRV